MSWSKINWSWVIKYYGKEYTYERRYTLGRFTGNHFETTILVAQKRDNLYFADNLYDFWTDIFYPLPRISICINEIQY